MTTQAANAFSCRLFHTVPATWPPGLPDRDCLQAWSRSSGLEHAAHVAQLMTYCVLVEDAFARPVPYGVLQYSDARRQIPYTADRKCEVLQLADEI